MHSHEQKYRVINELELNTLHYFSDQNHQIANHKIKSALYHAPTLIIVAIEKLSGPFEKGQYCSAACILENMILTATEMGIGNVYLSGVTTALNGNMELLKNLKFLKIIRRLQLLQLEDRQKNYRQEILQKNA